MHVQKSSQTLQAASAKVLKHLSATWNLNSFEEWKKMSTVRTSLIYTSRKNNPVSNKCARKISTDLYFFGVIISVDDDIRMVTIRRMFGVISLALSSSVVSYRDP